MSTVEYHHYIPQFLLRNFAHDYKARPGKKKPNPGPKIYPGNKVLNAVNMVPDDPEFVETQVKRTFGQNDMYKDGSVLPAGQWNDVEKKLGQLENAASRVFRKITDAHRTDQPDVHLTDVEYGVLRKFVFAMKLRSTLFFRTFNHQRIEDYTENDTEKLRTYMQKKKHTRPIDVWLETIVEILGIEFDEKDEWALKLQDRIYGPHAIWAQMVMRLMYPVVCTPSEADEEFVLSEHAYSLHEGPVIPGSIWTEFHILCILAPRLALLLRSDLLPEVVEDRDETIKKQKEKDLHECMQKYPEPSDAKSLFHDLPVAKPRYTYTRDNNNRLVLNGSGVVCEKLSLPIFRFDSEIIQLINSLILEEAFDLSMIVFESRHALRLALEAYLSRPITTGRFSMKRLSRHTADARLVYLKKLEHVAQMLGSKVEAVYKPAIVTTLLPREMAVGIALDQFTIEGNEPLPCHHHHAGQVRQRSDPSM